MGIEQRAVCPENDALVEFMRKWWTDLSENPPKSHSDNTEKTIQRAFTNVCRCKTHIKTLKDFQSVKGVGKWFVKNMRGFFSSDIGDSGGGDLPKEGNKKVTRTRDYLPQKNSAAYAMLITLYRGIEKGIKFMHKQELIDAADSSGLARVPIAPEKGRGKQGLPGSSKKEWYSGWSAMGKLVDKGLVVKTSCPAKYKLTEAGHQAACDCLSRSNMFGSHSLLVNRKEQSDSKTQDDDNLNYVSAGSDEEVELISVDLVTKPTRDNIHLESLDRVTVRGDSFDTSTSSSLEKGQPNSGSNMNSINCRSSTSIEVCASSSRPVSASENHAGKMSDLVHHANQHVLRMPPLGLLEKFENTYEVILILDDREHFARSKSRSIVDNICAQYKIQIEVKRLPVGDAIWVARHRQRATDYVLDFIVERKNVDDLRSSIRDNRYKDQKLRLLRTGLKKIIYVVEGDPNVCEAAESIKTACFTTEILEGFDVQRTSSLPDTVKRYGYLTLAITDYYKSLCEGGRPSTSSCPVYAEFIKKCEDLDKMTISDVFASQLMQVPQVTEEVAVAVLDCYPTLYSLACAYFLLDGDTRAQEELLMKSGNNVINAAASKNIFRLVWQR